jgi:hypothetical protein
MDAIRNRQIHGDFGFSIIRDSNYISDGRNARLTAPDGHANQQEERDSGDYVAALQKALPPGCLLLVDGTAHFAFLA